MTAFQAALLAGALLLTAAGVGFLIASSLATRRLFADAEAKPLPEPAPSVSLCRPIEGAADHAAETLCSFLDQDYPGQWEVVVGTLSETDPIVAVVRQVQAERPEAPLRLTIAELHGANRKTSIMLRQTAVATGDVLVFVDADVTVTPDYLRWLVPALVDPEVGCVTCLPRGLPAKSLGGRLCSLHYDFVYLPQWAAGDSLTGIEWAIGKTMASRREVIESYGGFGTYLDALADDYEFGNRAARQGYRVVLLPYLVDCHMPEETAGAFFARLQRWYRTIRRARPKQFAGMIFCHPTPFALMTVALAPGLWWTWALAAAVLALRYGLAAWLNRDVVRLRQGNRDLWLLPLVDLLELLTFLGAYLRQTIVWRGHRYRLRPDGALEPLDPDASRR